MLTGRAPEAAEEFARYTDGSSDGVRIAVSLRRLRAVVRVTDAAVTSGPGDNGTWDAGETVEAELRFSAPVTVSGGRAGAHARARRCAPRAAALTGGSGTDRLTFALTVAEADDGAPRAWVAPNGLALNGATLSAEGGGRVDTAFTAAPRVAGTDVAPDASGDRRWDAGETIEVRLTFTEPVTVEGGPPLLEVAVAESPWPLMLGLASGSGSATLVFSAQVPEDAGDLTGLAVVADSLTANGAAIVSAASGLAADLAHDSTDADGGAGRARNGRSADGGVPRPSGRPRRVGVRLRAALQRGVPAELAHTEGPRARGDRRDAHRDRARGARRETRSGTSR